MNKWIYLIFVFCSLSWATTPPWQQELLTKIHQSPLNSISKISEVVLHFPTPNGEFIAFEVFETPVMPAGLVKRFPQIKTYSGRGVENPNLRVSVRMYNDKAKILILGKNQPIYIDEIAGGDLRVSYTEYGVEQHQTDTQLSSCGCGGEIHPPHYDENTLRDFPYCVGEDEPCFEIGNNLVTFRYAGMITTEANNAVADGTTAGGLAWIAAMVNQVNLVWIRELSFRLEMIEESDLLIYTNERPTPINFTAHDMYVELPRILSHIELIVGPGGYGTPQESLNWEYGALFNTGYAGGLAYVPGATSANLPSYGIHIHEIGHNLGSSHNCTSEGGWASTFGGTAMCNRENTLPGSYGDQYSSHTIDIAIRYQNQPFGGSHYDYQKGFSQEVTTNSIPEVIVPESGFYIPKETPFILEGIAIGSEDDNFTYSWEQNDASDYGWSPPEFPPDTGPLFPSVDAKPEGNVRYFPAMESLLENNYFTGNIEKLPFAAREINMRLLVRDNDLYSGAFTYKNVQFFVDENAGSFRVTSQGGTEVWQTGDSYAVRWEVANTDDPNGVNSQLVHILLSVDGGENFDILLDEYVENDGHHEITVPNLPSINNARIMVRSADNIFFDINASPLQIENLQEPQLTTNTNEISVSNPIDDSQEITVEMSNTGEEGSILVYDIITEVHRQGDGYLTFDGQDDFVDLGANLLHGSGDFSISLWVKSSTTDAVIIQQRNGGFNGEHQLKFNSSGQLDFFTYKDGYQWTAVTPLAYNDNQWHHVVVVQSNAFNGGKIFVDGLETASNSGGVVYLEGNIHSYLGADMRDHVKFLQGDINDVLLFTSALSPIEINHIYFAGFEFNPLYDNGGYVSSATLKAFYPILNMSGNILTDVTGNHHGNISGAVWSGDLISIPDWLSVSPASGWIEEGQTEMISVTVQTTGLTPNADYSGNLIVNSNTDVSPLLIPVELSISSGWLQGDVDNDGNLNILDVVLVVNIVLGVHENPTEYELWAADMNQDGNIDILDVVFLVNTILGN